MSERKVEKIVCLLNLPTVYKEMLCCFNECKRLINISELSNVTFEQQPLWNNTLFEHKGKSLFFKNWVMSKFLFVKDLFNKNCEFKTLQELSNDLKKKNNWLCEYNILKKVIKKKSACFDMKCCFYTKILKRNVYNFHKGTFDIFDKRCKFYYLNLLHKKFKPPCYQSAFNNLFNIGRDNWKDIYKRKVKNMYDKRLSEFNYKLLNNILNCNSFQYKCKSRSNANCEFCPCEKEDIKHLLFDCLSVQRLWQKLKIILNFDVCWKHIIIGFYLEKNSKTVFFKYNYIICNL